MNVEAFILAGGKSSRMGEDKGLMLLDGKAMIQHVIEVISSCGVKVSIVSNNPAYNVFNLPVFEDKIKEKGPLSGLYTALEYSNSEYVLIISCDTPFINSDIITALIKNISDGKCIIAKDRQQIQPLVGIYPVQIIPKIFHAIVHNNLSMLGFIEECDVITINFSNFAKDNREPFYNINSKKELNRLKLK